MTLKGTTICAVRKDGKIAVAGDGQVTMGESTIFKATAHKVRRIYGGKVVTGFAGTVSDAFALCDRFEAKLEQYSGNLERRRRAGAGMAQRQGHAQTGGHADRRQRRNADDRLRHGRGHRAG